MVFVQGPGVAQLLQDEQAFATLDSESFFSYFEKPATLLQPGGRDPSSAADGHGMRTSSRRHSVHSKRASSKNAWVPSKNYASEQKRRKKLNSSLLELRSLVPKITKLDKASIIGDTITHLKELNRQIEELEMTLEVLQYSSCSQSDSEELPRFQLDGLERSQVSALSSNPSEEEDDERCRNSIKVAVVKVEDEIYKLTITCQLHKISLLEVSRAIESHIIDIVCSSFSTATASCSNTAICVFIVKVTRKFDSLGEPADVELDEHGVGGSGVEHPEAVDERLSTSMKQCAVEGFQKDK